LQAPFQPDFWTTVNLFRNDFSGQEVNLRIGMGRDRKGQLLLAFNTGDGWILPGGKESKARRKLLDFFQRWTVYFDDEYWINEIEGVAHFYRGDYKLFIDRMWDWEDLRERGSEEDWYEASAISPEDKTDADYLAELMVGLLGYAHDIFSNVEVDEEEYSLALDELEISALGE
jgi:hypothetical protein